jgi:tetratricopeptide (TPR) repeat protein
MPRAATADIAHTASTDHRIVREAGKQPARRPRPQSARVPLLDFYRGAPDLSDRELARDLGVAVYQLTTRGQPLTEPDGEFAVRQLDQAVRDCPADLDAWEAKGGILKTMRRPVPAIEAFTTMLSRAPRHETALVSLGTIHRDLGQADVAVGYWRRAVEVNPWVAEYRRNLVLQLAELDAWDELRPHCRAWLDLDPASVEARRVWVAGLVKAGRRAEAEAEFGKIRALRPPDLGRLEVWFARLMR